MQEAEEMQFQSLGGGKPPGGKNGKPEVKKTKTKAKKKKKQISNIFKKVLIQILIEIQMIINFYLGL